MSLDEVVSDARKQLNLETRLGYLGKGNGDPRDRVQQGNYFVRVVEADGRLSAPFSLPVHPNANLPVQDGFAVKLGYEDNELVILSAYRPGVKSAGTNPLVLNPLDKVVNKFISQTNFATFYFDRQGDVANKPFYVAILPAIVITGTTTQLFPGDEIDLSSFVPATDEKCYAVVLWKTDNTLEAFASTPIDSSDPLTIDDLQDAINQRSTGSIPICAWQLIGDQNVLSADETQRVDLRQFINVIDEATGGGSGITELTGDVTAGPGSGSEAATLATVNSDVGSFTNANLTVNGKGLVTAAANGTAPAPPTAHYVTTQAEAGLSNEFNLGGLTDGLLKHTVSAGVSTPATATPGTDFTTPTGTENLSGKTITASSLIASALSLLIGGFKAIFFHANSADRTYTLPNYNGTLATLDGVETFTNKTLAAPTIASFANANHDHTNSAGGGQITDAALSAAVGIAKGGTGQTTKTAAMDALSPTSAKGDLLVDNGTNVIALAVGVTNGHVLTVDSGQASGLKYAAVPTVISQYAVIEEEVTSGQAGGTSAATTWTTRNLNNEITDPTNIVSISSNQFTLPPGTYRIFVNSPFLGNATTTGSGRLRLRDITNSATIQISANHGILLNQSVNMTMEAYFVNAGTTAYAIQYYLTVGRTTNGLGLAVSEAGVNEKYTQVSIEKLS